MLATALLFLAPLMLDDGLADQIAHCGIAPDQVHVRYEKDLQDETAVIDTPAASLTLPQLNCLAGLAMSGRFVAFADPAAQARFDPLVQRAERKDATIEARQWLADHGLLEKLPVYDPRRQTLAEFGVALETLCGAPAGSLLKAEGRQLMIVPPKDLDLPRPDLARFECVISAAIATSSDPAIFSIGFTGNEAIRGE